jgi:phosphopantothenoylcysteine decarboxylase/phosphopantothenate--cysteine ligase
MIKGSRIVVGITGGIAAYKAVEVIRELQRKGADVVVAVTPSALRFIGEATLSAISGKPVYKDLFQSNGSVSHVSISSWGDCFLIVPATANTIAKISCGISDNPVTELALCFGKGIICPSMNVRMYENKVTQENIKRLRILGYEIVEPEKGYLACGERGKGRLASLEHIVDSVLYYLSPKVLEGEKVVVTAGPTREYIDPVRFISNPSTGKMGFALARAAKALGADVVLVSGKTCIKPPYGVKFVEVETADEMYRAVKDNMEDATVFISAAAVGDYSPIKVSKEKVKKTEGVFKLELKRTVDILEDVGKNKREGQIIVGFAAETENLIENARRKLKRKNLDVIVANDVKKRIFGSDETEVVLITDSVEEKLSGSKEEVSFEILKLISKIRKE